MKRSAHLFLLIFLPTVLWANGLEFRLTLSGKVLLGIAYRHQLDTNTALRLGGFLGITGAPVGMQVGMLQDITPSKAWTPFFEIGADVIFFKQQGSIAQKIYPSGSLGLSYRDRKSVV